MAKKVSEDERNVVDSSRGSSNNNVNNNNNNFTNYTHKT